MTLTNAHAAPAALLTALAALAACDASQPMSRSDAAAPRTRDSRLVEDADGLVTISNGIRIAHSEWRDLGFRWEWSATPLK